MTQSKLGQYQQVERSGDPEISPHQAVKMLLEGAGERMAAAALAIEHDQTERKAEMIGKAMSIVSSLQQMLDMENGGEVAVNLDRLYTYIIEKLTQGNLQNDANAVQEAHKLLGTITEGWVSITDEVNELYAQAIELANQEQQTSPSENPDTPS